MIKLVVLLGVVAGISAGMTRSLRQRAAERRARELDFFKAELAALEERRMEGSLDEHGYRREYDAVLIECGRRGYTIEEIEQS